MLIGQSLGDALGVTVMGIVALIAGVPLALNWRGLRDHEINRWRRVNKSVPGIFRRSEFSQLAAMYVFSVGLVLIGMVCLVSEAAALVAGQIG